jgi:hypothetical protein
MKIMHLLASAGLLASVAATSFAQVGARPQIYSDVVPPDKGTAEVGLSFSAKLDKPSGQSLRLKYLPYLSRQVQVGGELSYDHAGGFSGGFLNLIGNYNFVPKASTDYAINRTIPYVGLAAGVSYGDENGSDYGAQVGVKHFLTNDVSLFGELQWRHLTDPDDDTTALILGLSTYLR